MKELTDESLFNLAEPLAIKVVEVYVSAGLSPEGKKVHGTLTEASLRKAKAREIYRLTAWFREDLDRVRRMLKQIF